MITALQNFTAKRGRPFFFFLLIVVGVSFVLYLSQGTSVFDFFPDPNREKKEFYGSDFNDPDQRRLLSITNQVAADLGAILPPTRDVLEKADARYFESLQNQLRAAYQPENRDKVDQGTLQNMFGYMQSWRNFPDAVKVMAIARSGNYDFEFSDASIRTKLIMDSLADELNFMPLDVNNPSINSYYHDFVTQLNPVLSEDENRSTAFTNIARYRGVAPRDVDAILYSHFRSHQLDRSFTQAGYTLDTEGEIEMHRDQFAWDAEAISLSSDDFPFNSPALASISFQSIPKVGNKISIDLGRANASFEFVGTPKDANGSSYFVTLGKNIETSLRALNKKILKSKLNLKTRLSTKSISLLVENGALSRKNPSFTSNSKSLAFDYSLESKLKSFYDEVKTAPQFVEPAQTYASVVNFDSSNFYTPFPEPDEVRMQSYFERNKMLFEPLPQAPSLDSLQKKSGAKGPEGERGADGNSTKAGGKLLLTQTSDADLNNSQTPLVAYEDVKEEVRKRIMEGDKLDADREASELAKESALAFLEAINALGDRLHSSYESYPQIRQSKELLESLKVSGGKLNRVKFSSKDMGLQSRILGLETRASERKANRNPLKEVEELTEKRFFTRSIRQTQKGYAVFILDRKTEESISVFEKADFRLLYREYLKKMKTIEFGKWIDTQFEKIAKTGSSFSLGSKVAFKAKSAPAIRSSYDRKSSKIRNQLQDLQNERSDISSAEQEKNATKAQNARKSELDKQIEDLRELQGVVNSQRLLSNQLIEVVDTMEPDGQWVEQERTEGSAFFVKLTGVYTLRNQNADKEQLKNRVSNLEYSRAEVARSLILDDLIASGSSQ
ncbi:MAG: hypothetical protein P8N49_05795 [Opitutales bacterium]|nr:hypothetical protein [Opitutales bacterium]